jgi:succinoglycan biosynthesis protein ExoM
MEEQRTGHGYNIVDEWQAESRTASTERQTTPARLTIAVLTYLRPKDISALLPLLVEQSSQAREAGLSAEILVVDNDPAGGARDQVLDFAARTSDCRIRYENEVTPGISAARNRALSAAHESDLLVFIDDDERPQEAWLAHLLKTYALHKPTAVVGRVTSTYEVEPDPWVAAGEFFKRRSLPTGTRVDVAATNNLLLDLSQIRARNLHFDLDYGITGGDDTMFTRTLHRTGGKMVWCDEAVVVDVVPAARTTRKWVLQRAFSSGNTWSLVSIKLQQAPVLRALLRLRLSFQGAVRLAAGLALAMAGTAASSAAHQAKGLRTCSRGAGMMAGAWGYRFEEYRR